MEPFIEKITLVEDFRFDSPKSMFMGRVMGKSPPYPTRSILVQPCVFVLQVRSDLDISEIVFLLCPFSFRGG